MILLFADEVPVVMCGVAKILVKDMDNSFFCCLFLLFLMFQSVSQASQG